jgi:hydrogenase-4 component F
MGLILWAAPLSAILILFMTKATRTHHFISIAVSVIELIVTWVLTWKVMVEGIVEYGFVGKLFYLDALSIILLNLVVIISMLTSIYNIGHLNYEKENGEIGANRIRLFYMLLYGFIFTMVFTLTVNNMGLMWIAVEAITLASTFLVGFHNDKKAVEAAWKYVIICSVGIAIAMLGIVFLHISSLGINNGVGILDWTTLYDNADKLNGPVLRFAFIFILIGFGTKAGLAPMHTWLPDAHSQAPSSVSALLSGVLLNTSLYPIIRAVSIVNKNMDSSAFTGRLLIGIGLISLAAAAIFIITQKDYKRLLAYSSIEHIGIITIVMGLFTPAAVFAGLFHMINHSFTKSMLFITSGNILQKYGTREIVKVQSLIKVLPISGTVFLIGLFAIGGTPPFSIFASEFSILISIFANQNFVLGVTIIALLTLVFVGIVSTLFRMFYSGENEESVTLGETNKYGVAVIVILLIIISITGFYMPEGVINLMVDAQNIITGGI